MVRQDELRSILLVKAIEETDRAGTIIPPADRSASTREARRADGEATAPGDGVQQGAFSEAAQRISVERSRILLRKIVARHPFVDTVLNLTGGPAWAGWVLVALGLFFGFALSALDGTRRINILAFPMIGVVLWNLAVYITIFFHWTRAGSTTVQRRRRMPEALTNLWTRFVARQAAKSGAFSVPLAEALRRFVTEWFEIARPLLVARAVRVFHLAAVAVGIGLIAGLYVRGIAFDYEAGWESTFFEAPRVRVLLSVIYGPASVITGISIPDASYLETIRWKDGVGGERAARWMHLLAATVALYVVLPRLMLSLAGTICILRRSRRMPLPAPLTAYLRIPLGALGVAHRGLVTIIPYAYEPSAAARAGLRTLLPLALGENVTLDARSPVRYGDEEEFLQALSKSGKPDIVVLLFNLATTPEEENHGTMIAGVRDCLTAKRLIAQLIVLVDEAPYAERMADGGADSRLTERRHAWQEFVAARGVGLCIVNLSVAASEEAPSPGQADCVRNALWQPHSA
ncbi:MAG TPA: DUF2868 domain-containing protein [Burkholderiales bacterium]|nr:DUF2868 domain-containing protein [Burkholderiales bacterium]